MTPGIVQQHGVLAPDECAQWVRAAFAVRSEWTPCFEGAQFTLGRAFYTHLEDDRAAAYFAGAHASDAVVERSLPGMQGRVRAWLGQLLGAPVGRRPGWCGPGLHIFPAGGWLAHHGGDVHFDTEGLLGDALDARAPALSAILMLQPPARGGGLRVWDTVYDGDDVVPEWERARTPSRTLDYAPGDLVVIDSYRLHQIQPFAGARDRVSITAHAVLHEGRWQSWF